MTDNNDMLTPDVRFHLIQKMERHKVCALAGTTLLPHEAKYLEFHLVSGVILFQRNVESLSQVNELIGNVSERLTTEGLPPLVMADHEGDFVSELRKIIGVPPSPMAIAATGDLALAREVARETGRAMRKLGVNVVLAPVADCCFDLASPVTGLRTFGREPEKVAEFVSATLAGFREAGVLTCAKHFPGHGSTAEDSHETLPEVDKSREALVREDLVPFRTAVSEGVDMVMVSHVAFPMGETSITPASFDARVMKGLLREEMGFEGAVITDSLEMAGARWYAQGKGGGFAGSFERSLLAGSDLLLHTHPIPETVEIEGASQPVMSFNVMETIIRTLEKVVDRGRIDEKLAEAAERSEALQNLLEILERSTDRIVALRGRLSEMPEPPRAVTRGSKVIEFNAYPSVPAVYRRVAEESISLWGSAPLSAIPPDAECLVVPVEWCPSQFLKKHDLDAFIDVLCKRFPRWGRTEVASSFVLGEDGTHRPDIKPGPTVVDAQRFTGSDLPRGADLPEAEAVVIVMSSRGIPPEEFTAGLEDFASQHELLTVIIVGWPVTDWVPEGCPALLCFGASAHVASAVSEILSGYAEPRGTISGLFPTGAP